MDYEILIPILGIFGLFIAMPWIIFHYITKWKQQATLSVPDEKLLDELHSAAKRLNDRLETIERIMSAENPDWKQKTLPMERYKEDDAGLLGRADELLAEQERLLSRKGR
ncbi:MAG: envelope stress response membrane protein PspB [Sphingomonas sp.]|nr:envelope stress response membrane protein PspB [Sphingomonas sp.]